MGSSLQRNGIRHGLPGRGDCGKIWDGGIGDESGGLCCSVAVQTRQGQQARALSRVVGGPFSVTAKLSFFVSSNGHPPTEVFISMGTDNDNPSRPQTPPNPVPPGYFSASFERLIRENEMADWAGAYTLFGEHFLLSMSALGIHLTYLLACLLARHCRNILRCPHRPHPTDTHETQRPP